MSGQMRIVQSSALAAIPWRNRGGLTREIASVSDHTGLVWRISLADVTAEGPFSTFSGLKRVLTVVSGAGMRLDGADADKVIEARPLQPVRFDGTQPVMGKLPEGPVQNFNIIYRPDAAEADVAVLKGTHDRLIAVDQGGTLALHAVAGRVHVAGRRLPPGATALLEKARIVISEDAQLIVATLITHGEAAQRTADIP